MQQPFRIGVLAATSGKVAEYGVAVRNGIEMARGERPELFPCIKLKQKKFDMLGLYLLPSQATQFLRTSQELEFHPKMFGSTFMESRSLLKEVWPLLDGVVYLHLDTPDSFRADYEKKFGFADQIPYAWSAYQFALFAGRRFGGTVEANWNPDSVVQSIEKVSALDKPIELIESGDKKGERYYRFPLSMVRIEREKLV